MATLYGKLAASAPWRAGNSKMARVQERALASLLEEGQDEGVFCSSKAKHSSGFGIAPPARRPIKPLLSGNAAACGFFLLHRS
jgi:hypothetical protein